MSPAAPEPLPAVDPTRAGLPPAEIAVIGGSGLYRLLADAVEVTVDTPYGSPSGPLTVGRIGDRAVAFLPRHGPRHHLPPHRIPYRANMWALHHLGVTRIVAPCAVGSLRPDIHPGQFVVCDQFVDRTWGRPDTFFDGPEVRHVPLADPYCPEVRAAATAALTSAGSTVHDAGTVVVVQGPRFSTRAESAWFRAAGWDVVNMTQYPEVALARELGMCYCGVALVTDRDTGWGDTGWGDTGGEDTGEPDKGATGAGPAASAPVTMEAVMEVLGTMVGTLRTAVQDLAGLIPATRSCACGDG